MIYSHDCMKKLHIKRKLLHLTISSNEEIFFFGINYILLLTSVCTFPEIVLDDLCFLLHFASYHFRSRDHFLSAPKIAHCLVSTMLMN